MILLCLLSVVVDEALDVLLDRLALARISSAVAALFFEEYTDGLVLETARKTVNDYDVSAFVNLAGFRGPIWMDLSYASKDIYYSGRLVPGMLVMSFAEGLVIGPGSWTIAVLHVGADVG